MHIYQCAPRVLQKLEQCVPFLHVWQENWGKQLQSIAPRVHAASASSWAQSEAPGSSSGAGTPAAPGTRQPGQSAQAESIQGVFPSKMLLTTAPPAETIVE